MNTYHVGVTMYNSFYIEADTEDEAKQEVCNMEAVDLLCDVLLSITYIDKEKEK